MTKEPNFKRTKYSCYFAYLAMSSIFSLPPILFVTFRETYGISYTLLGTLVLTNFCTQLTIDLIFTFFSKLFNIKMTVRIMPLLTSLGLFIYAFSPYIFPNHVYVGLLIGTVIFSVSAGLSEVLLSPVIAALPSDNPQRDMSMLHSLFAWGVLTVVSLSTAFLSLAGTDNWMYLTMFWAAVPILSSIAFFLSPMPEMNMSSAEGKREKASNRKTLGIALCVLCIFLGSAAENTMTNWISAYMENALGIPKVWGDILGLALFALLMGLGRTLYAKYGKKILSVLMISMTGAAACYLVAGVSSNLFVSMIACILTGLCTAMLWPGSLIMMEENFPALGVAAYALMAAGGDFGASIAPQMLGIIVDKVAVSDWATQTSLRLGLAPDQLGMKVGMITASLFPILGMGVLFIVKRYLKKTRS